MEALQVVSGYILFIILGQFLKLIGRLPRESAGAVSTLVLYVTLPCAIVKVLNGTPFDPNMVLCLAAGFLISWVLIGATRLICRRDPKQAKFAMLNLPGWNIGTFAMPYTASFVTPEGFLAICFFDMGNALMCTGGTYAFVCSESGVPLREKLVSIVRRLLSSGPICTYLIVFVLMLTHSQLPPGIIRIIDIGASANSFLAMIMIGMSVNLAINPEHLRLFGRLLFWRYVINLATAVLLYYVLPFEEPTRMAVALVMLAPIPAMGIVFTMKAKLDWEASANINTLSIIISVVLMSTLITLAF